MMKCGILFFSAIIGCLLLYILASVFHAAPLQSFLQHEQKILLIIVCCVFIGFWVSFVNDALAVLSPIPLGKKELSFKLTNMRYGSPEIPTYDDPPVNIKDRGAVPDNAEMCYVGRYEKEQIEQDYSGSFN